MGKIILMAVFLLSLFVPSNHVFAKEVTAVLHVSGMTCSACPITIRRRLLTMRGVSKAVVKMAAGTATVSFEDNVQSAAAMADAITKLGYPTTLKGEAK